MKNKVGKLLVLALALVMMISLSACDGGNVQEDNKATGSSDEAGYVIKIASADGSGGITHSGLKLFEQLVEEQSKGSIDVQIYMDSLLGGEREIIEGVLLGSIQMCPTSQGIFGVYDPKLALTELPYLFKSHEAFEAASDGETGDYLNGLWEQNGFTCLGQFQMGYRVIANQKKEIVTPNDIAGMKIRVPEVETYVQTFAALGANPTPMSWSEIYTGMQQGTIDGMECSPSAIWDSKIHEVSKYITVTNHLMATGALVISSEYLNSFPEDLQAIVKDAAAETTSYLRKAFVEDEEVTLKKFEDYGLKVTYLTDEQYNAFKDLIMPLYEKSWNDAFGSDVIEKAFSYSE